MSELLQTWGYQVLTAATIAEACTEVRRHAGVIDIVVSDLRLANDEDGIDAIERVRAVYGAPLPALLITGDTSPDEVQARAQQRPPGPVQAGAAEGSLHGPAPPRVRRRPCSTSRSSSATPSPAPATGPGEPPGQADQRGTQSDTSRCEGRRHLPQVRRRAQPRRGRADLGLRPGELDEGAFLARDPAPARGRRVAARLHADPGRPALARGERLPGGGRRRAVGGAAQHRHPDPPSR